MVTLDFPVELSNNAVNIKKSESSSHDVSQYDSKLIDTLENEHEELFSLFNQVLNYAKDNNFNTLQLSLVEFATAFTTHIKLEDEQLYGYLKILASGKSELEQQIVSDFSLEMKEISSSIFNILSHSPYIPVTKHSVSKFILEFEKVGKLLTDRIEREENVLYPIYKNSCS